MADNGDEDLSVVAIIAFSALNDNTKHGPLANSDAAFQSRDSTSFSYRLEVF